MQSAETIPLLAVNCPKQRPLVPCINIKCDDCFPSMLKMLHLTLSRKHSANLQRDIMKK